MLLEDQECNHASTSNLFFVRYVEIYKKGDLVMRKGELCEIVNIDYTLKPPCCNVKVRKTGQIVNTEFDKLDMVGVVSCSFYMYVLYLRC